MFSNPLMSGKGEDPYTELLIQSDHADGSTDIQDSSSNAYTIGKNGGIHHEADQAKFGDTAIYFDGAGDYLGITDTITFGSNDLVVDFWIYPMPTGTTEEILDPRLASNDARPVLWRVGTTLNYYVNGSVRIAGSITFDTWQHVAVVRSGGVTRLFINGSQVGSAWTDGTDYLASSMRIGSHFLTPNTYDFTGYMDEIRVSNGTDRGWSGGFTPPTAPY